MSDRRDALLFFYRRRPNDPNAGSRVPLRTLAFFGVMIVLIGLAGWLYLHQAAEVAAYAHDIRRLEHERERLHREIIALRAEVAALGSLSRAYEWGTEHGYRLPSPYDPSGHLIVEHAPVRSSLPPKGQDESLASEMAAEPVERSWNGPVGRLISRFQDWIDAPVDDIH